jgi:outer membrane protein assembly factor BamB
VRVLWTYQLRRSGAELADGSSAPLHWDGQAVLVPVSHFEHDREARGADSSKRGYLFDIHRVADGGGTVQSFRARSSLISQSWSFLQLAGELVLHVGTFHALPGAAPLTELPFVDACDRVGRGLFLQEQGRLIFADGRHATVSCHDVVSKVRVWTLELANTHRYRIGPIALQGGQLVCHGRDALNYIDPATGAIERQQTFPRLDKLFPAVSYEGDLLFAYSNWTSGGLVRFDPAQDRLKWRFTKRGGGASPRGGLLPVVGRTAILSLNDGSSLVGVDLDSGKARWTFRAQWLYTPVEICDRSIIFGTAGGHGRHLRRHDAETGETEWAVQMDGGCPHYASLGDDLVAGDWGGRLRRIRRTDGAVVDQLDLGAPLTTAPLVVGTDVHVLLWPTDGAPPALIAVRT